MPIDEDISALAPLDQVEAIKECLIAKATGHEYGDKNDTYKYLRRGLRTNLPNIYSKLPEYVRRCSDLGQFWSFIQPRLATYRERRDFIAESFGPALAFLEANDRSPGVFPVTEVLVRFDADAIHTAWEKALVRRVNDPGGAITAARTLIETVCKHILDDVGIVYSDDADLPKLWYLTAEQLNLAPSQHQEEIFKSILGNCQSIVNGLGAIRNRVGDAHGQGRRPVKPDPRHAELAVNLAGAMSAFLVATWHQRGGGNNPL